MTERKKNILGKLLISAFFVVAGAGVLSLETGVSTAAEEVKPAAYALAYREYTIESYTPSMTVKDPFGNVVETADGTFTPLRAGDYTLFSAGKTTVLRVFATIPETMYNYEYAFEEEYKTGEMISFPFVTVSSAVQNKIDCDIYIEYEGRIEEVLPEGQDTYQPARAGSYAVVYAYEDIFGYISTSANYFEVKDAPVIGYLPPETLSLGKRIQLEKIYAYNGEESVEANLEVVSPSAQQVDISSGAFLADEMGTYIYVVTAEIGGETVEERYEIPCDIFTHDLFDPTTLAQAPVSGFALPEICRKTGDGVLLEATGTGGKYTYNSVIDLNSISRDTNLLSFFPYSADGIGHVEDLQIIFTDIYDKDNSVGIQFKCSPFHDNLTYVTAFHNGRHYAFDNANWIYTGVNGPVLIGDQYFFAGLMRNHYSMQMKGDDGLEVYSLTLDYPNRQVVLDLTSEGEGRYALMDFDNPVWCGGAEYVWDGFTTGEVYMTVEFGTVVGKSAAVIVTEVAGQSLSGTEVNDELPPSLVIDIEDEYKSAMPYGVKGVSYAIPAARAHDTISGEAEVRVSLSVNGQNVPYQGGEFVPDKAGRYEVTYEAEDLRGNRAKRTLVFEVYETRPETEIGIGKYDKPIPGKYFKIPEVTVSGASGNCVVKTEIEYHGSRIEADRKGKIFVDKVGEIKLHVEVFDWLGQRVTDTLTIPVTSDEMRIGVAERYGSVQKGRTLVFPDAEVYDFDGRGNSDVVQKIFVNGRALEGNEYTVQDGDAALEIRYEVTCAGKTAEYSYTASVYDGLEDIFRTDGTYSVAGGHDDEIHFAFEKDGYFELINAVSHNALRLSFSVPVYGFDYMDVYLADSANSEISVFVRFTEYSRTQVRMQLNGKGDYYLLDGSLSANVLFSFFYDCERLIFKRPVNEKVIFKIDECVNGDAFNGFISGGAYLKVCVGGVKSRSVVRLAGVSNETFVTNLLTGRDSVQPVISTYTEKEFVNQAFGGTYMVEPARAYDVVQGTFDVRTTVTAPDGRKLCDAQILKENFFFKADQYGTYKVVYETFDNTYTIKSVKTLSVEVKDETAPEISLSGEVNAEAALGDIFTVTGATATDNVDTELDVKIIIYDPQYRNKVVQAGEIYRFTYKGVYKIVWLATDDSGNTGREVRYIEVK